MESRYVAYAKRVGYKKKGSLWYDKMGFIVSEKEIKDSLDEIVRIVSGTEEL